MHREKGGGGGGSDVMNGNLPGIPGDKWRLKNSFFVEEASVEPTRNPSWSGGGGCGGCGCGCS